MNVTKILSLASVAAAFFLTLHSADARTWTSSDGVKTFEGELLSYDAASGKVSVTLANGKELTFTQDKLSEADITYLKEKGDIPPTEEKPTDGSSTGAVEDVPETIPDPDGLPMPAFRDAVGQITATLGAKPDKPAKRSWISKAKGSVRIVGQFRKPATSEAGELRMLVDGEVIWQRTFEAGDTIPHAFDVTALELEKHSTIDILLLASKTSEQCVLIGGLQILAEPFLSRWHADAPTGYPTWSEEEKVALRQKGQEILQAIRDASKAKSRRMVIPPGDYLFHANWSHASTLTNLTDLEIIATGVTFWFEPPMIHGLSFDNCSNVTVQGLTIDFTQPCWFQAKVNAVDREKGTVKAAFTKGYEALSPEGEIVNTDEGRAMMFYDERGRFIRQGHAPGSWQVVPGSNTIVCSEIGRSGIPEALKEGDYVVGTIRTGSALRSLNCSGMTYEDVNIFSSPGAAVVERYGGGGHIYRRVRCTRRPFTNRLHAFGSDIFHLSGADRGPQLERCEAAYGADDTLNIHGRFGRVVREESGNTYFLQGVYEKGDILEFRGQTDLELLGSATVLSAEKTTEGPTVEINETYKATADFLVKLDKPLNLPELSLVVMDSKCSAQDWVVRDCWLHDDFQRTMVNGAPGGLFENNTLQNLGHGLPVHFETWGPWMEGPFASNLTIRNNRFLEVPAPHIEVSMHPAGPGSNIRRFEAKPVKNMTIAGNYFQRSTGVPLSIHNVDGLKIHGNSIDYPSDAPMAEGLANSSKVNWLYLQDCDKVSLQGNMENRR